MECPKTYGQEPKTKRLESLSAPAAEEPGTKSIRCIGNAELAAEPAFLNSRFPIGPFQRFENRALILRHGLLVNVDPGT